MNKNLTFRYSAHQFMYWAAVGGVVSFAATYLLSLGFSAAQVGGVLFSALLLSFLMQPVIGAFADRAEKNILPGMIVALSALCTVCFLSARFLPLPQWAFEVIYVIGVMALDMQVPLMNSLSVYYTKRGYVINYGLGRGVGGFGFAVATLGYGYLMEDLGEDWMPIAAVMFIILAAAITLTYPRVNEKEAVSEEGAISAPCTIPEFVSKYRWYCISLFGILFLGAFHVMTENYLIEIFKRIGGDSSNVGVALFVATVTELPGMTLYPIFLKKYGSRKLLMTSGIFFMVKAVLLTLAGSVTAIYLIQLLQCITYVLMSMSQLYYAEECTSAADMIKGQSMITASYTLGCAVGNLLGGVIISSMGVKSMLYAGIGISALAVLVLTFTLPRAARERINNTVR